MVDDDPDSGEFFWNEIRNWNSKPSDYHVVFFDKDKGVSRAWISDKRLEKFDGKVKEVGNSRLMKAVKLAQEATNMPIEERREVYCFASRFSGEWGKNVLPWPGHEEASVVNDKSTAAESILEGGNLSGLESDDDGVDTDILAIAERVDVNPEMNSSFSHFTCNVLESVPSSDF